MEKSKLEITASSDPIDIRIYMNNILHLILIKKDFIALQSWKENDNSCKIEIYTKHKDIILEYNSIEKWNKILELINRHL